MFAPTAFRAVRERAITADDYAALAADDARRLAGRPRLLNGSARGRIRARAERSAAARRARTIRARSSRRSPARRCGPAPAAAARVSAGCRGPGRRSPGAGSWYEADVAIDPLGSRDRRCGDGRGDRRLSRTLPSGRTRPARPGRPLRPDRLGAGGLRPSACAARRRPGEAARRLQQPGPGRWKPRGFFHPDTLSFGAGLMLSRIVAAAQGVAGVTRGAADPLARYRRPAGRRPTAPSGSCRRKAC